MRRRKKGASRWHLLRRPRRKARAARWWSDPSQVDGYREEGKKEGSARGGGLPHYLPPFSLPVGANQGLRSPLLLQAAPAAA